MTTRGADQWHIAKNTSNGHVRYVAHFDHNGITWTQFNHPTHPNPLTSTG